MIPANTRESGLAGRPCRYCIAHWAGMTATDREPLVPEDMDCQAHHGEHDAEDQRVIALATEIARRCCGTRNPSDEKIAWFLGDADQVVDDFDPVPEVWRVRKLPESRNDCDDEIVQRLRINDVTYVALEGGKDSAGQLVRLSTFRSWGRDTEPPLEAVTP